VLISAVVITYNEESNIERCLRSLSFADEIIVLDSFSTDRTVEIALRFTDKVSQRKFTGFSEQKNAAMDMAGSEWVMIVDADEVVTPELAQEIRRVVVESPHNAYRVPRRTCFLGKLIRNCGWYPDYTIRLARKSKARFADRLVHEVLEVDGTSGTLQNCMIHFSYRNMDDAARKMITYARAAARQKMLDGQKAHITDIALTPGLTFLKKLILQQGFRDGIYGLIISGMSACGVFFRYVMLWEMTRSKTGSKEQHNDE